MIEFLMIIGMAIGLTLSIVGGMWCGFKIVDFATNGKLNKLLK